MLVYFIVILLYLTLILNKFHAIDVCNGSYCPPMVVKWKMDSSYADKEPAPIILQENDDPSGCVCRDHPGDYVVCFGMENCKFMPLKLKITSTVLRIKNTQIVQFKPKDFQHLTHLQTLQVESNFYLQNILSGAFLNLTNLINMSISYNSNLKTLENGSFDGLLNLKELYLVKNGFIDLYNVTIALSRQYLPNLFEMSLNENLFNEIRENDFMPMLNSTLEVLNLILCRIEYIHPDALMPLKNLQVLRIGENSFNKSEVITNVINRTINNNKIPLKMVNLYSVGFRKMPPKDLLNVIANSNISNLNLAHNQFEIINNASFPYMPNLFVLDLKNDLILNITNDAFKNLPNLKTLLLSGNKLNGLPEGVLMKNLTYLDLQQNSGNSFSPSYFSIYKNRFLHMNQLKYLDLSYNRLNVIYNTTFVGLMNLQILGLKNASIYYIANNSFIDLQKLVFLNLENNYFVKNKPENFTGEIFKGLNSLEVLELGGCSITYFSKNLFKYLKQLKHLGLARNKLTSLNAEYFATLIHLKSIDLSYNQLIPWYNKRVFIKNQQLDNINLNKNKLGYISLRMLEDFTNLTHLKLDENPFLCDCTNWNYFRKYTIMYSSKNITNLLNENSINCVYPENYNNLTIIQYFEQKTFCKTETNHHLLLILTLVIISLLIIILIVLIYYYRWYIRYWIFLARLYLSRKGKINITTEKTSYQNYEYDAFVSYSNEDRNFVIRLVTMLENYEPYLKLCVYERDFQIGTIISESVLESVAKSRKTLLIISDNYAKSQWCRWESQIAEHHRLFFGNEHGEYVDDTLVLIKLGPINNNHLTPTLKYLLKTRIYLAWENNEKKQKIFWEKLRNALAPPKNDIIIENTHI